MAARPKGRDLLLAISIVLAACGGAESPAGQDDPSAVLAAYVDAVNARDIDAVVALFDDEVTITGHPADYSPTTPVRGLVEAKVMVGQTILRASGSDAYQVSDIEVSSDVVTWTHVFNGVAHSCTGTDEIVVADGKIVRWNYSPIECS